jgi:hypothetical protein
MWGFRSFEPRTSHASSCLTRCFRPCRLSRLSCASLTTDASRANGHTHVSSHVRTHLSTREPYLPAAVARGDSPRSVVEAFFSRMETETRLHIGFLPRQAHVGSTKYSRCDFIGLIRHITCCSRACTALTVIRLQALEVFCVSDGNDWANHS